MHNSFSMAHQSLSLNLGLIFALLWVMCHASKIAQTPEHGSPPSMKTTEKSSNDVKNAIVLIGLNNLAKDFSGYGVIPVLEKDIINLFDANATLADKIVGDSRNAQRTAETAQSRLLPLITTPKKALLLFALHETLLKSNKGQIDKNCVVLSKDDLQELLKGETNGQR